MHGCATTWSASLGLLPLAGARAHGAWPTGGAPGLGAHLRVYTSELLAGQGRHGRRQVAYRRGPLGYRQQQQQTRKGACNHPGMRRMERQYGRRGARSGTEGGARWRQAAGAGDRPCMGHVAACGQSAGRDPTRWLHAPDQRREWHWRGQIAGKSCSRCSARDSRAASGAPPQRGRAGCRPGCRLRLAQSVPCTFHLIRSPTVPPEDRPRTRVGFRSDGHQRQPHRPRHHHCRAADGAAAVRQPQGASQRRRR